MDIISEKNSLIDINKMLPVPTNGDIFLKTYPDSELMNIAYDDGIQYVYVQVPGSRMRFTGEWWFMKYSSKEE